MISTSSPRRVAFFGGQGCRSLFTTETSTLAVKNVSGSVAAAWLLTKCHRAFLDELSIALEEERDIGSMSILDELKELSTPESLLAPPELHHTNPIVQGVSLLLHQLVNYLVHFDARTSDKTEDPSFQKQALSPWDEVVGFCSGVLPCMVVATSKTVEEYAESSMQAIRLAFWIGYRAASFCNNLSGPDWRKHTWTVALGGYNQEHVTEFNDKQSAGSKLKVRLSARVSPHAITLSGTSESLEAFKAFYSIPDSSAEIVAVNALYHGGEGSEPVVELLLQDVKRRNIAFPAHTDFHTPIRSCVDGKLLEVIGAGQSLVEIAIRGILIEALNWHDTWENIASVGSEEPETSTTNKIEFHTFGPHSRTFFSRSRNLPNITVLDHSKEDYQEIPDDLDDCSIAIVGMAVNFPGASDKETLWKNLENGVNTVQKIPSARFSAADLEGGTDSRRLFTEYGNFVEKPWAFDHAFFDISPREAKSMDPQQKLLLQAGLHALDDAGYVPDSTPTFQRDSFGCYVGIATGDYVDNLRNDIDVYYSTGTLRAFLSGKISYANKFSGPSLVVDTACSASSVSIYQACRALVNGDCNAALAGGANAILSPDMNIGLGRAHFLSSTGQCKAFDASADGYCRSEGCGLFVLKRLSDARAENDRIYGVIRGIAVNQSGQSNSITHPHAATQQQLFQKVLSKAKIDPSSIGVVEAHGTGTQAGDAVEINSIKSVFGSNDRDVYLTSIKGNIGHAEAASGSASMAKVLMMLKHKKIPIQTGLKTINPRLAAVMSENMRIATETAEWKINPNGLPRRAMINNFGAAGSNAAMIVEEYQGDDLSLVKTADRSAYIFRISGRTTTAVKELRKRYLHLLESSDVDLTLPNICYTATARRRQYEHQISVVCKNLDDLAQKLQDPVITPRRVSGKPVTLVFSGQGGAYNGMGRELLATSPSFRELVDSCEQLLNTMGFPSVRRMLLGTCDGEESQDTYTSQTAIFILQYALASLWLSWGVRPSCVMGHSIGEYAAMVISGVLSLSDGLRLVASRASLIKQHCPTKSTGMMACTIGTDDALQMIADHQNVCPDLQIACQNTNDDSVIAGPLDQLQQFENIAKRAAYRCKLLDVPYGFHSSALDPILDEFREVTSSVTYSSPKMRVGSTVHGAYLPSDTIDAEYFLRQTRSTVRFAQLVDTMGAEDEFLPTTFIEIGPTPMILPMIKKTLKVSSSHDFISSLNTKETAWETLSSSLSKVDCQSSPVNWRRVFEGSGAALCDAPPYPLEQNELWIPYKEPKMGLVAPAPPASSTLNGLLSRKIEDPESDVLTFETDVESLGPYIKGHLVGGVALCPASIYHEMAIEAAYFGRPADGDVPIVTDLNFEGPLVYAPADDRIVRLRMDKKPGSKGISFRFSSYSPTKPDHTKGHCSGLLKFEKSVNTEKSFSRRAAMVKRQLTHLGSQQDTSDTFRTNILYETIFPRVVLYSKSYQSIKRLTVAGSGLEGYGTFQLSSSAIREGCVMSPTYFDTLLHGAGFMANSQAAATEAFICVKVETANMLFDQIDQTGEYTIYCSLLDCVENTLIADSYALTPNGTLVASVEGIHFKKLNLRSFQSHLSVQQAQVKPKPQMQTSLASSVVSSDDEDDDVFSDSASTISASSETNYTDVGMKGNGIKGSDLVVKTLSEVCGAEKNECNNSKSLSELGVDSLMSIEICTSLKNHMPQLEIDASTLLGMNTIGELVEYIDRASGQSRPSQPPSTITKRKEPVRKQAPKEKPRQAAQSKTRSGPTVEIVETRLKEICGISKSTLDPSSTLGSLGFDSLLSLEVREMFKKDLHVDISPEQLHGDVTVAELLDLVVKPKSAAPTRDASPHPKSDVQMLGLKPILLQKGEEGRTPMVLFHDGSGSFAAYSKLSKVSFPVYGMANPSLGTGKTWAPSIEEMAEQYADAIKSNISGPIVIGGWSFGGILAFQIAQQMQKLGVKVEGVILIDSPSPIEHKPLPQGVIDYVLRDVDSKARQTLEPQFRSHAAILGQYKPPTDQSKAKFALLPSQDTLNTSELCGVSYPWLEKHSSQAETILQWESLIRSEVRILPIPGNHFEPFKTENIGKTTEMLRDAYAYVTEAK